MPLVMWHCPHCGAPQAETARCWVCRRSSTTCSTCRLFRASLAADLNYCALDRRRRPLTGLELRGCWEERPSNLQAPRVAGAPAASRPPADLAAVGGAPVRGFVPIEDVRPTRAAAPDAPAATADLVDIDVPLVPRDRREGWEGRTSLFGEPDR